MKAAARVYTLLRSRRLAVWLIIAFIVYAALATTLSGDDYSRPYGSSVFIALAALLGASTAACAWERTRAAVRMRGRQGVTQGAVRRLREHPRAVIDVQVGVEDVPVRVSKALRSLHLRVQRYGEVIDARSGIGATIGSPLFHCSLALLFVVIALGQLTRTEGLMGVVAGGAKPDIRESYGVLEAGPLAGELSGRIIAVPRIERSFVANGVQQGVTPYVEIRSPDGAVLASGYAYANHPVRYRSMLVHANDHGLAAVVSVVSPGGSLEQEVLLDYTASGSQVTPNGFAVTGPSGETLATVLLDLPESGDASGSVPSVRVRANSGASSPSQHASIEAVVQQGDSVDLGQGLVLTVGQLTTYARLSVVDDGSVYYIYALFAIAVAGLSIALLSPPREARVLLVGEGTPRLHVDVRHSRGDPHFPARVVEALERAAGAKEDA
ncbi:MAG: cytochrome c biogenesis protein ResB [Coriobacteriales bacterium]|nr:cytochrome c biogenesis protein ResB [Actinomycetes bacterium]